MTATTTRTRATAAKTAATKAEQTVRRAKAPGTKTKIAQATEKLTARQAITDKLSNMHMPKGTKIVLSFVANLITIGASYYVGATVTVALATMVAGLTSSFFLVWMTLFIGQVLSLIGALIMGAKVQFWILNDSYKAVLAAPSKVTSKVSGWFTKSAA